MGFFEYLSTHWYAGPALVLLILLTVFVWIMAGISGRKRNEERERTIAEIEKEKELRKEFKNIDELTFAEGKDDYRLIIGMCANIQQQLEKAEDMNSVFAELPQVKKYIYTLGYVFEDSKKALSNFFRSNGEPLLSVSAQAVAEIIGGDFAGIFTKEYIMLDENDETTSVDYNELEEMDEKFSELIKTCGDEIYLKVASYIRENKNIFLN